MDRQIYEKTNIWTDKYMDRLIYGQIDRQTGDKLDKKSLLN